MLVLISGTNRPGSNSRRIASEIQRVYAELGVAVKLVDLAQMPPEIFCPTSYATKPAAFAPLSDAILGATGLIVVTPEYNGGIPGVLKYFIDMLKFPESFVGRPVCFVGVAAGIWGALRPVEQLQQVFGYRNALIYPERVFIPQVYTVLDDQGRLKSAEIRDRLKQQATGFMDFVQRLKGPCLAASYKPVAERLAVCSWSMQATNAQELFDRLEATGVKSLQIALDPIRENPAAWADFGAKCAQRGISLVSGMIATVGEDYSTLETIKQTGGVVPDATWEQNWKNIQEDAALAVSLGLKLVTFHAGFLPHESTDPAFAKLVGRIRQIADLFAEKGLELGFETGQETADTLDSFLSQLGRPNVGVNFDPANMILYDKGEPLAALKTLAPWLKQCHIKDANRTATPGTWGEEVTTGTGQVDWAGFFALLRDLAFAGNTCIEREAGTQRVADIRTAAEYVTKLTSAS